MRSHVQAAHGHQPRQNRLHLGSKGDPADLLVEKQQPSPVTVVAPYPAVAVPGEGVVHVPAIRAARQAVLNPCRSEWKVLRGSDMPSLSRKRANHFEKACVYDPNRSGSNLGNSCVSPARSYAGIWVMVSSVM